MNPKRHLGRFYQRRRITRLIRRSVASAFSGGLRQGFPVHIRNPHPGISELVVEADGKASVRLVAPLERVYLTMTLGDDAPAQEATP